MKTVFIRKSKSQANWFNEKFIAANKGDAEKFFPGSPIQTVKGGWNVTTQEDQVSADVEFDAQSNVSARFFGGFK